MNFDTSQPIPPLPVTARILPEEAARLIGCAKHDIPILVRAGLLKALGHPPPNGVKYFSRRRVLELCADDAWLTRVSDALVRHWQRKNLRRGDVPPPGPSRLARVDVGDSEEENSGGRVSNSVHRESNP